jgi:hypothetical protein
MSSQITKEELTRIKGSFQAKYGYEMDEWTAVILTELNDRFGNFSQTVQQSTKEIGNAAQLIKGQVHAVHFENDRQAFLFGLGKLLSPSLVALTGILFIAYYVGQYEKYNEISDFVEQYPNFNAFKQMIRVADIREFESKKYLVLRPAAKANSIKIGKEYEYLKKEKAVIVLLESDNQ